jgi:uncharacterized protein (DUF2267 family)
MNREHTNPLTSSATAGKANEEAGMRRSSPAREEVHDRAALRHEARAIATYAEFIHALESKGFGSKAEAEQAAVAVLCALEQRLTDGAGFKLESQLPVRLKAVAHAGENQCDCVTAARQMPAFDPPQPSKGGALRAPRDPPEQRCRSDFMPACMDRLARE